MGNFVLLKLNTCNLVVKKKNLGQALLCNSDPGSLLRLKSGCQLGLQSPEGLITWQDLLPGQLTCLDDSRKPQSLKREALP